MDNNMLKEIAFNKCGDDNRLGFTICKTRYAN